MSTAVTPPPPLRRAVVLMTASGVLPPVAGLLTQPILAQGLGVVGRGEMAAALAPAVLVLSAATLGLPEALTYHLAKHPRITRGALAWASAVSCALGGFSLLLAWWLLPFLSAGDRLLGDLIFLAVGMTVPALVTGALRGAASGRQMWGAVAYERLVGVVLRTGGFTALWLLGELTVLSAVIVSVSSLWIASIAYWRLLLPVARRHGEQDPDSSTVRLLLSFGSRTWLGAVASIVLARIGQVLMVPLSDAEQLGLYVVASTIADLPLIAAIAIRDALYGVNSQTKDAPRLAATTRLTLLVAMLGSVPVAATVPFWISPLFGAEFGAALVPTLMLMVSAMMCIPGLLASSGVAAWGRPGLRSVGLLVALLANLAVFVLLVPALGVYGACWTSLASNVVMSTFMVVAASRVMGIPASAFLVVRRSDGAVLRRQLSDLVGSGLRRWKGARA